MGIRIPLGDIIRAVWPGTWIGKIFSKTKGINIDLGGGNQIGLNQKHGPTKRHGKPHRRGGRLQ